MLQNPSVCRRATPCTPANFSEQIYCAVHHGAQPAEQLATAVGVPYKRFVNATNPNRAETVFAAAWLEPLLHATGDLSLLRYLADKMNCAVVPLPAAVSSGDEIYRRFLVLAQEVGQAAEVYTAADADGSISPDEADRFARECDDITNVVQMLKAAAREKSRSLSHPSSVHASGRGLPLSGCQAATGVDAKPAPARMSLPVSAPARKAVRS